MARSVVVAVFVAVATLSAVVTLDHTVSAYTPRPSIAISGNGDLTAANGVTGGSGTPSDPFIIEGWEIDASTSNGIQMGYTDAHVVIRDVRIHSATPPYYAIHLHSTVNVLVQNATLEQNMQAVLVDASFNVTLSSNTIVGEPYPFNRVDAITVVQTENLTVSDNHVSSQDGGGAMLYNCENVTFSGNDIQGGWYGVLLSSSNNLTVVANRILSNDYDGVVINGAKPRNVQLAGNEISNNSAHGLLLDDSVNTTVVGNTLTGNRYGLRTAFYVTDLAITANNVSSNTEKGIWIWQAWRVTITANTIRENAQGLVVDYSTDTSVFHNNFIGNAVQASDADGQGDAWDDGYPSGGNYWSDYAGVDAFGGPGQNLSGPDGLGDSPYVLDADSQDRYPLMGQYSSTYGRFPASPVMRPARLTGAGLSDVELSWDPSADDGGGEADVAGYELWFGSAFDASGTGYALLTTVPAGTSTFVHSNSGLGDPSTYYYQVRAVEGGSGRVAPSRHQAGKASESLSPGLHLLSAPFVVADPAIPALLQTVAFDVVRTYNASEPDPWKAYYVGRSGDLGAVGWGEAFWVNVTSASDFVVAGLVEEAPTFPLQPGWNLVPYVSPNAEPWETSLVEVAGAQRVEAFDSAAGSPYALRAVAPGEMLRPGQAYWVLVAEPGGAWTQG